jgi:hypothetical protein
MKPPRKHFTDQRDIEGYPTEEQLEAVVDTWIPSRMSMSKEPVAKVLAKPRYDTVKERWTCLAEVAGVLAIIEINIFPKEPA